MARCAIQSFPAYDVLCQLFCTLAERPDENVKIHRIRYISKLLESPEIIAQVADDFYSNSLVHLLDLLCS